MDDKSYKVLAADDEEELLEVLALFLQKENLQLLKAYNGIQALELYKREQPHLLLLDIMMPEMNGFEVLRRIRQVSKVPAIMMTARNQDYDKILGLELGADDYITKPYNPLEVAARVKAQLRRTYDYDSYRRAEEEEIKRFSLTLKVKEGTLQKGETYIPLTKTEFLILELLMRTPGRIYTKQQIFEHAWEDIYIGDDSTVMVHISNLRAKIEDNPRQPEMLKTMKGLGYKFEKE